DVRPRLMRGREMRQTFKLRIAARMTLHGGVLAAWPDWKSTWRMLFLAGASAFRPWPQLSLEYESGRFECVFLRATSPGPPACSGVKRGAANELLMTARLMLQRCATLPVAPDVGRTASPSAVPDGLAVRPTCVSHSPRSFP